VRDERIRFLAWYHVRRIAAHYAVWPSSDRIRKSVTTSM
jgi:hypothetical protein